MRGNLKVLGLVLLAACVAGAVAAPGTMAEFQFHSDSERTVLTGQNVGNTKLTYGSSTIECTAAEFESTLTATKVVSKQTGAGIAAETYESDTVTVTPHLSGCSFLGQAATVNFNDCAFVIDSDTTLGNPDEFEKEGGGKTKEEHANMQIECAKDHKVEIDTVLCTFTIADQLVKHAVRSENDTEGSIAFKTTAKGIVVSKKQTTGSQTGCPLVPTGAILNVTGAATYECFEDESEGPLNETARTTPKGLTEEGDAAKCAVEAVPAPLLGEPGSIFTGENEGVEKFFFGAAGTTECASSQFEGAATEEEEAQGLIAVTLRPTSSECTFGGQPATAKTNDCAFVLGQSTNGEGHADLEIECAPTGGHRIEIDTVVCTITIGSQVVKGAVHYEEDTATSFTAKITAKKIVIGKEKTTGSQAGCLLFPTGEIGNLTVTHTVSCFEDTAASPQKNPTTPEGTEEGEAVECAFEGS